MGSYAETNPFRFSSKYADDTTGLYYYGYRYYSPVVGRWLSRDPIGENGGTNLYAFVGNDGVNGWDYLGLKVSVIVLGDSMTFGTHNKNTGQFFTGYAAYLTIKNTGNLWFYAGGPGQRTRDIKKRYKNPTALCDEKVAILGMMGMNDALSLWQDNEFDEAIKAKNYQKRYDSALEGWEGLYKSLMSDFSRLDPKKKVLFVTITVPAVANTPKLGDHFRVISGKINRFLTSLNADMVKTCSPVGGWWGCEVADASGMTHTMLTDAQGKPDPARGDDGIHFFDYKSKAIADMVSRIVNKWSGE